MAKSGPTSIAAMQFKPGLSVAFDADAFDDAIRAHGVEFVHWRGMRNPAGLGDKFDSRRSGDDHVGASNGLVYTRAGRFIALLTSNSKDLRAAAEGQIDSAAAQLTPTRFYECSTGGCGNERVYLQPMDRIYLADESVLVPHSQLNEAHRTGLDRLRFPANEVQDLLDASGAKYQQGVDFELVDGNIRWTGTNRPGVDEDGKGRVYAVRFLYRPFWYVERLVHEIRVAQGVAGFGTPIPAQQSSSPLGIPGSIAVGNERVTQVMPQSAFVLRENVYRNEKQDDQAPDPNSPRQVAAPADGGFGPR